MLPPDPGAPTRRVALAALAALALPARAQRPVSKRLVVGVEAALQVSGLAQRLAVALARDTGLQIAWEPGPGGLLLPRLESGEFDAALTQAPELERVLENKGRVHDRRPIAQTELVLVGPARGPGAVPGVAQARDALAALGLIAAAGVRGEAGFVVHGEPSGEREREQALWKALGPQPVGPWLRTAAPGATAVLTLAAQTASHALVERGVWSTQGAGSGLELLVQGDARLAATYHVMRSFRGTHPAAKLMVNWLAGRNGQRVVARFGRGYRAAA